MRYYGLHFVADDGCPLQVRIDTRTCALWARTCPQGGEWTAWRRLDVNRNADGTLNEQVATTANAKTADTATRLAREVTINLGGAVSGTGRFDGASDVYIETSMDGNSGIYANLVDYGNRIAALESQLGAGGGGSGTDAATRLETLERRQNNIISQIRTLRRYVFPDSEDIWDPDLGY